MEEQDKNPFAVQTPEDISAQEAFDLFVDVFTDFFHVPNPGHTFINGPRGSGKSMMFRYMLPDCQELKWKAPVKEHPYFSIYIPIKKTTVNTVDLERLQKHANFLLNEHLLVCFIATKIFNTIATLVSDAEYENYDIGEESRMFYNNFIQKAKESGYRGTTPEIASNSSAYVIFNQIELICKGLQNEVNKYVKVLAFSDSIPLYQGALCEYLDFLYPLLEELATLSFMPVGKPLYLLIDDADNLSLTQTIILNTWVSQRTSAQVSLKISTQLDYKTYRTASNVTIDSPHDYNEVNISTVYTSQKNYYRKRVQEIIERRLSSAGLPISVNNFFPVDEQQEKKIEAISQQILSGEIQTPSAYWEKDRVYRYAVSEYMKQLSGPSKSTGKGSSKSGMNFKYAGFRDMVDVSSGIVRNFLELAARMYSLEQAVAAAGEDVIAVTPSRQSKIIKDYSSEFLHADLEKLVETDKAVGGTTAIKLQNLVHSLGGIFKATMFSNAAQRRVFSIALTNVPDAEILEVLKLGVRYGYLQESTISYREGTGRTKRYSLSRRLAPSFSLMATSFAGDQFITNADLRAAMQNHRAFVAKFRRDHQLEEQSDNEPAIKRSLFEQGNLFDGVE
jgi:hypothetical protein